VDLSQKLFKSDIYAVVIIALYTKYELQTLPNWKWPTQWRGWHLKQYPASNPAAGFDQSGPLALLLKQMASMVYMPGIAWQDVATDVPGTIQEAEASTSMLCVWPII
jgi:hypothetical protein